MSRVSGARASGEACVLMESGGFGHGGMGHGGGSTPRSTAASESLRDEVLVSTSQLQKELLSVVDRLERSGEGSGAPPRYLPQQHPGQSQQVSLDHQQLQPSLVQQARAYNMLCVGYT